MLPRLQAWAWTRQWGGVSGAALTTEAPGRCPGRKTDLEHRDGHTDMPSLGVTDTPQSLGTLRAHRGTGTCRTNDQSPVKRRTPHRCITEREPGGRAVLPSRGFCTQPGLRLTRNPGVEQSDPKLMEVQFPPLGRMDAQHGHSVRLH